MENFDFNFDLPAEEAAPIQETAPAIEAAQAGVDPQKLAQIEQQLAEANRFKQAITQAVAPDMAPSQASQEQQQALQLIDQLISQKLGQVTAQQQLEQKYSAQYPDLVPFKDQVIAEASHIWNQANARGQVMSDDDAVKQAAENWKNRLQSYSSQSQQTAHQDEMKRLALPFNVSPNPQGQKPSSLGEALNKVGNDDAAFAQLMKSMKSQGRLPR
jgi:hypothetical protein